ncbi:MAG TPA: hypothetical protein VGG98_05740 [Solirubrobacteraceae bacterium]
MSADPSRQAAGPQDGPGSAGDPSEAELRAAYEAELDRITSAEVMLQAAVSLLNVGGRRLGLGGAPGAPVGAGAGRDLEQVRDAIDGVRALLEILERRRPQELKPLRDALSQLQMAYAREAQPASGADQTARPKAEEAAPGGGQGKPTGGDQPAGEGKPNGPGPAQSSGRLWVPGS